MAAPRTKHCCDRLFAEVSSTCPDHAQPWECSDILLAYSAKFNEYGIVVHDGGSSSVQIFYCPWCGAALPQSRRDEWFDKLDGMGIEPGDTAVPIEMESDEWWQE